MYYGFPHASYQHVWIGTIFAVASLTDWLDGYLARKWNVSSSFGAFLDPVADKLMVSTCLILLCGRYGPTLCIPTCIILAREIAVSALREWMAQRNQRDVVQVGIQGKIKTALTMIALTILLYVPASTPLQLSSTALMSSFRGGTDIASIMLHGGIGLLYLCAIVTVSSGSVYFRAAGSSFFPSTTRTTENNDEKNQE